METGVGVVGLGRTTETKGRSVGRRGEIVRDG